MAQLQALVLGPRHRRVDLELVQRDQTTVQQVVVLVDEVTQLGVVINDDDRNRQMVRHVENSGRVDVSGSPESFDAAQDRSACEPGLVGAMHDHVAQGLVLVSRVVAYIDRQLARSLEAAHRVYQDNGFWTSPRRSAR